MIALLAQKLQRRWVPKWYEAFAADDGGFHERMGKSFQPIKTGQRRLLTQCRQLAVYAHAIAEGNMYFNPDLAKHLDFILTYYKGDKAGSWIFAIDDHFDNKEEIYDLYAHGFVIFALAHYERALQDGQAKVLALETLFFINENFNMTEFPGLAEALDNDYNVIDLPRRHESHMHLLEACLFANEVFKDDAFLEMADFLINLFQSYFYQEDQNLLGEYYDKDLKPAARDGHIVTEPGHYCEWIWLLKKYSHIRGDPTKYDVLCRLLLDWANAYGWDSKYGGIYDELNANNEVITDTKRLWPFAEALKANALMLDSGVDKDGVKATIAQMVQVFNDYYIDERGFWTEWLSRDLQPQTDYMPGTTPYHVYFGIVESQATLQNRGETKSWRVGAIAGLYDLRRGVSENVKRIRRLFTKDT